MLLVLDTVAPQLLSDHHRPVSIPTDTIGASLSASDLHVLYEHFGRDQDRVDYSAFCLFLDDHSRITDRMAIESAYALVRFTILRVTIYQSYCLSFVFVQ